jgi:hypothetical protein
MKALEERRVSYWEIGDWESISVMISILRSYVLKSDGVLIKMESLCANKRDTTMVTLFAQASRTSTPSYISIKILRIVALKSLSRTIPCVLVSLRRHDMKAML